MISDKMKEELEKSSVIREMFEEGRRLAGIYGEDRVFDFSLGNPSLETPDSVNRALKELIDEEGRGGLHGYMSNAGHMDVREKVAEDLNKRGKSSFKASGIIMTVGAAGGLNVVLKSILNPDEEVVVIAPFFGEYRAYVENYGGKLVTVPANPPSFSPDFKAFEASLTEKTKAVIINTPNNPTGIVYSEEDIKRLSDILKRAEEKYSHPIYLISDEPYRELVFTDEIIPFIPDFYKNTVTVYSYSKSFSLAGERIGYIAVSESLQDYSDFTGAAVVATRILGFVNAPSLFQKVIGRCIDEKPDIGYYNKNREYLISLFKELGFQHARAQGAFYLFLKAPDGDDMKFCNEAKKHNILLVPGRAFGCEGYVRLAYCVPFNKVESSAPAFRKLAEAYGL